MNIIDIIRFDEDKELSMVGGKVIGEGGYGCILKPGLTCKGKEMKTKKFITKIQVENSTSRREIKIGEKVKKIPLYKNFLILLNFLSILLFEAKRKHPEEFF